MWGIWKGFFSSKRRVDFISNFIYYIKFRPSYCWSHLIWWLYKYLLALTKRNFLCTREIGSSSGIQFKLCFAISEKYKRNKEATLRIPRKCYYCCSFCKITYTPTIAWAILELNENPFHWKQKQPTTEWAKNLHTYKQILKGILRGLIGGGWWGWGRWWCWWQTIY